MASAVVRFVNTDGEMHPPVGAALARLFEAIAPGEALTDDALTDWIVHVGAVRGDGVEKHYRLTVGATTVETDFGLDFTTSTLTFTVAAPPDQIDAVVEALVEAGRGVGLVRV